MPLSVLVKLSCQVAEGPTGGAVVQESEGDESEDEESEILEESPCGRWLKRREVVSYRDVPGVDFNNII